MRTLILILTITTLTCKAQEYKYEVIESIGMAVKISGEIKISKDSILVTTIGESGPIKAEYIITNTNNGITHLTDGTNNHSFFIDESPGRKKGKKYKSIIYFTFNSATSTSLIKYYITPTH